jgi:hypothetical protein
MPYSLMSNGVMREFDFYAPPGWEYWVGKAWEQRRIGLPLIIALHGGGEDPLKFQEDWFFPWIWNLGLNSDGNPGDPVTPGDPRILDHQCFVLYPYGLGWMTKSLFDLAYLLKELPAIPSLPAVFPTKPDLGPLYRDAGTVRAFNAGFSGWGVLADDVAFIKAAIDAMNNMLKEALLAAAAGLPEDFPWEQPAVRPSQTERKSPDLFDQYRRFLFGYSNGAMFGHRLVNQMPDYWAAFWAMSGTCGGKPNVNVSTDEDRVVNLPEDGRYAVSLFAHHGDKDTTVPPGDWGEDDFVYQSPQLGSDGYQMMVDAGFPTSLDYRPGYLPLTQASKGYRTYNNVDSQSPFRLRTGIKGTDQAKSKSWPDAENWDGFNPTVVIYRDFEMEHTKFTDPGNRYFFEKDVWRFFEHHPRILR